jgi:hypothetical protein
MKKWLLIVPLISVLTAYAQQDTSAPKFGWSHSVVAGLTLTQISFTDWAQGGENSLAWTTSLEGKSIDDQPTINWANGYRFAFGQARLSDQGLRKTDDKIDLESVLTYKLGNLVNPYFAATLKTQFTRGYKYESSGNSVSVSNFFDPGYLVQSLGVGTQPIPEVKTRLGVALREIVTSEFTAIYANDPATRVAGGFESVTEVNWNLAENIMFTSKLELFDPFKKMDQVIVRNDNTLALKVNKYITTVLNLQLVNEAPVSPRTQVKEVIAIGLSYALL